MRQAPLLLLVLLVAVGIGLGLRVMLLAPGPGQSAGAGALPSATGLTNWPSSIAGVPQGHVYTGIAEEPADVNPFTANGNVARRYVLGFTHETLLDCDPVTGVLRGALATTFEPSSDGTSCTFRLRDGVRFADGSPLSMADVLFGWELAQSKHVPLGFVADGFDRVKSVDVLDDRRFSVTFRGVHYAAVQAVGETWIVAKRQFFVDRVAEQAKLASEPVPPVGSADFGRLLAQIDHECGPGTGPYVLHNRPDGPISWRRRQDLVLLRNEYCWRRNAVPGTWNFAGIRLLFRDPTAAFTALVRHEVDWYSSPTIDEIVHSNPDLLSAYEKLSFDYRMLGVFRIVWNCRRTPFDDPQVRRALGMLFDLDAILAVFGGNGTKSKALAKPGSPEYPHELAPLPFDPAECRRLLRQAGFDPENGTPLRIKLLAPQGLDAMRRTLDLLADTAKRAGVDLQIRSREYAPFVAEMNEHEWDALFVQQMFRAWADPCDFVHSEALDNFGAWAHPEADRLALAAREELDPEHRTALLHELHTLVYREQPTTFLLHPKVAMLLNVQVQHAAPGPLGLVLERAFVAPDCQRK